MLCLPATAVDQALEVAKVTSDMSFYKYTENKHGSKAIHIMAIFISRIVDLACFARRVSPDDRTFGRWRRDFLSMTQ